MLPFFKPSKKKPLYLAYASPPIEKEDTSCGQTDCMPGLVLTRKTKRAGQFYLTAQNKIYGLEAEFEGVFQEKQGLEEKKISQQSVLFLIAHSFQIPSDIRTMILTRHLHSHFQYKFISYLIQVAKVSHVQTIAFYLPIKAAAALTVVKHQCHTWMSVFQGRKPYILGIMDIDEKTQMDLIKFEEEASLKAQRDLWGAQKKNSFVRYYLKNNPLHAFWPLYNSDFDTSMC